LFNDNTVLQDFITSIIYFFNVAFGAHSYAAFCSQELDANGDDSLLTINPSKCYFGKYYMLLFLCINMVLLLNLVIALLGSIYRYYTERFQGLYY
jgi:hypothetical protein